MIPSSYSRVDSDDAEDHGRSVHGWQLEYSQIGRGTFSGRLEQFHLDNFQIFREKTNCVLMKCGSSWPGSVVCVLPINADGCARSGGHELPKKNFGLLSDGNNLPEILTPNLLDVVSIVFDRRWFALQAVDYGYPKVANLIWSQVGLPMSNEQFARLQVFFAEMFKQVEITPAIVSLPASRASLEDEIVTVLLECLSTTVPVNLQSETRQKILADAANAFVIRNAFDKPSIETLCLEVGISRRTLQNCFLQSYGISALQYLRATRLNAVRRDLKRNALQDNPLSIGVIAANWGFWHLSRFAGQYRELFGELPSETAAKLRTV